MTTVLELEAIGAVVDDGFCTITWGPRPKDKELAGRYRDHMMGFLSTVVRLRYRTDGAFPRNGSMVLWRQRRPPIGGAAMVIASVGGLEGSIDDPLWSAEDDHSEVSARFFELYPELEHFAFSIAPQFDSRRVKRVDDPSERIRDFSDFLEDEDEDAEAYEEFFGAQRQVRIPRQKRR